MSLQSQHKDPGGGLESSRSSTSFVASRTCWWPRWLLLPQRDSRVASSATSPSSRGLPSLARTAATRQEAPADHICRESNHESISATSRGVYGLRSCPAHHTFNSSQKLPDSANTQASRLRYMDEQAELAAKPIWSVPGLGACGCGWNKPPSSSASGDGGRGGSARRSPSLLSSSRERGAQASSLLPTAPTPLLSDNRAPAPPPGPGHLQALN